MLDIRVRGLSDFRRELRGVDRELPRELRMVHLRVAEMVARRAKAAAPGRHGAAITPRATQRAARLVIGQGPRGDSLAVFMGAKRRTGWYAAGRYRSSRGRQFQRWVGNQWDPGDGAGEPYYIGAAINAAIDPAIDMYGDTIEDLARKAFPT